MTLVWLFIFLISLIGINQFYIAWKISHMRSSGIYPLKDKASIAHVVRLRDLGLNTWAIRCYREINKVSLKEAKTTVASLK